MATPFVLLDVIEHTNGSITAKWETIADDGLPLIESDTFTPNSANDLEKEIAAWLEAKKEQREELNARPVPRNRQRKTRRVKRSTKLLDPDAVNRLKSKVDQQSQ